MPDTLSRTLPHTRRTLGDVDPVQPLDTTHPLLDGVQGFWLPLPRLTGGSRLYDVSGNGRHADLGNVGWRTLDGHITPYFESTETVTLPINHASTGITIWYWQYYDYATFEFPHQNGKVIDGGVNQQDSQVTYSRASNDFTSDLNFSPGLETRRWNFIIVSIEENYQLVSRNGLITTYTGGFTVEDGSSFVLGTANSSNEFIGGIRDIGYLYRTISEGEADAIYNQARRGFPDLLNRRSDVGLLGGGGGGTADTVSPGTGTALAEGFDPTLTATPNTIAVGTAQAAAQGFSTTVTATQNSIAAGTAQATAQGFEPTISADPNTIAATTGQAAAQGFDPTISEGAAGDTITADLGTAQAQGFASSISTNAATVTLGLGQAAANGFDPDVVADPSEINTGQGQAAATGFDPTVTTNARTVAPQLGTAQAGGFEPAVVDGTVGVATTMEIEARPLYEIDVEAKPLYRIRLFVKEQLP